MFLIDLEMKRFLKQNDNQITSIFKNLFSKGSLYKETSSKIIPKSCNVSINQF